MINIKLDPNWSLTSDTNQFILSYNDKAQSFHTTLENAITSYFQLKIRSSDAKTISGLLEYHKRLLEALCKVLSPLEIEVTIKKPKGDIQ